MSNPQDPQQPDQLPPDYELDAWRAVQQFKGPPPVTGDEQGR
ncbi:hypothetical protein [Streptomyces cadmiisoli]|nr:hypothetical protein [Streptomyces cadmiisoli]